MIKLDKKYLQPLDYLFIFRPTLFFPIWIITLSGYEASKLFSTQQGSWWTLDFNWNIVFNFFLITLACGSSFILNQIKDIKTDKENKKLFLISENYISAELASKIAYISIIISLIGLFIQDLSLGLLLSGVIAIWGYVYNFPPFEWKNKPILGVISNLIVGIFLFLTGWKMFSPINILAFVRFIPYFFGWGAIAILTTIPDFEGDKKNQKQTIAVLFGITQTIWISFIMVIIAFISGYLLEDPYITNPVLLSIPLFIITVIKPKNIWVLRTIRYSLLFIALFLCVGYPYFFVVIIINYYLSRFYYINRFDLDYPSFHIE